jgi:hypothetical protein
VRRELSNLLSIGIITSDATQNRLYYEVNQDYKFYKPLGQIFGGVAVEEDTPAASEEKASKKAKDHKKPADKAAAAPAPEPAKPKADVSAEHPMVKGFRALGKVELALLSGQFTRDDSAGIDVLLVGDINAAKADKFMADLEKSENKELRYTVISLDNYKYRVQINDRFINNVLNAKKQVIINAQEFNI